MATPEVRVRLSAEGVAEVVGAFRRIQDEQRRAGKAGKEGFDGWAAAAARLRGLLPAISVSVAAFTLARVTREAIDFADAMGKAAQKTGAGVENFSALTRAAELADVSNEQLRNGLVRTARVLDEAQGGGKAAIETLQRLGVSLDEVAGKDTAEAFAILAERIVAIPNPVNRAALAMEVFGRNGTELMPLLEDIAKKGMGGIALEAEAAGAIVTAEAAAMAQEVNDSYTRVQQAVRSVSTAFMLGFGDEFVTVMDESTQALQTQTEAARIWGDVMGRAFLGTAFTLRAFQLVVTYGMSAGPMIDEMIDRIRGRAPIAPGAGPDRAPLGTGAPAPDASGTGAAKAAREAERLAREGERRREQILDFERRLLEAQGRRHEAATHAIDDEIARYDELLRLEGVSEEQRRQSVAAAREALEAREYYQTVNEDAARSLAALDREIALIEQEIARGKIGQAEGSERILEVERRRLPVLEAQARLILEAARATGDPEAVARAEELAVVVGDVAVHADKSGREFAELRGQLRGVAQSGISDLFYDLATGAMSARDAVEAMAKSMLQSFARIAADRAAQRLFDVLLGGGAAGGSGGFFTSLFGGGGGKARGGYTGDGPTNMPADFVHGQEFVVRAAVVQQPGMRAYLERLNTGLPGGPAGPQVHQHSHQFSGENLHMTLRDWLERIAASELAGA